MVKILLVVAFSVLQMVRSNVAINDGVHVKEKASLLISSNTGRTRTKRSDDWGALEAVLAQQAQELSTLKAKLTTAQNKMAVMESEMNRLQDSHGSTFTRWGRSVCPNATELLYTGVVGGSPHGDTGGAANRLCLTTQPVFDNTLVDPVQGRLTGAEYYITGHQYTDVVCAVCRSHLSTTFMVPGTNRCPGGSVAQYNGHLSSTYYQNAAGAEFLCLDAHPEDRQGSQEQKQDSAYIEHAVTVCGSLPCPPYVNGQVATCVVCSK